MNSTFTISIPVDLLRDVRSAATRMDRPVSWIAREALKRFLTEPEQPALPMRAAFEPPSLAEAVEYGASRGATENQCVKFHAYYTANGWRVGKSPMKNWKGALVNWITPDR